MTKRSRRIAERVARVLSRIETPLTGTQRAAIRQILEAYFDVKRSDKEVEDYATLITRIYHEDRLH